MKRTLFGAALFLAAALAAGAQDFAVAGGTEFSSLDPQAAESLQEERVCSALFEGLLVPEPRTGAPLPGLAESWTFSKDFKTITFRLRPCSWSDGTPITAQTVVESWLRKLDPRNAFPYADLPATAIQGGLAYLAGKAGPEGVRLKALDERNLEVGLAEPMPQFPSLVLHQAFAVVPIHLVKKHGPAWWEPGKAAYSGPFALKEWKPGSRLVLSRNDGYWDRKSVGIDTISFFPAQDAEVAYKLFRSGALDWAEGPPAAELEEARAGGGLQESTSYAVYYFLFNSTKAPLNDPKVRQALSLALDTAAIAAAVPGVPVPASSFVPPGGGYAPAEVPGRDPERAKALLAEAGYPGGAGFPPLSLLYNATETNRRAAEAARDQWKAVLGIEIGLAPREWTAYLEARSGSRSFDLSRGAWAADYLDPAPFLNRWRSGALGNDSGYANPRFDEALAKASRLWGRPRLDALAEAESLLVEDAAVLPLFFYVDRNLIDLSRWTGWYANPLDQHPWKFIRPRRR